MSAVGSKKPQVQLSIVRSAKPRSRFTAQDALSHQQIEQTQQYIELAGLDAVCVGALVGAEEWDLRPILIVKGALTLLRVSRPDDDFKTQHLRSFQYYLSSYKSMQHGPAVVLNIGVKDGRVWLHRRFFRNTWAEIETEIRQRTKAEKLRNLLKITSQVKRLHKAGLFHGHIALSNLAWLETEPVLLDGGFEAFMASSRESQSTSPAEISGGEAGPHTDLYGLGILMGLLFAEELSPEEERFVASLVSSKPLLRPNIMQLEDFLSHRAGLLKLTSEVDAQEDPEMVRDVIKVVDEPDTRKSSAKEVIICLTEELRDKAKTVPAPSQQAVPAIEVKQEAISPRGTLSLGLMLATLTVLLTSYLVIYNNYFQKNAEQIIELENPQEYWSSGQPSLMAQVALAAVRNNNRLAQSVIIKDANSSKPTGGVRHDLIRVVFDSRWESQLSDKDRTLTLRLALATLIPEELKNVTPIAGSHAAVIYGILATLPIHSNVDGLKDVPVTALSGLPAPLGPAFHEMTPLNHPSVHDPSIRALAHILNGESNEQMVAGFFDKAQNDIETFKRLAVLVGMISTNPSLEEHIHLYLFTNSPLFARMWRWFEDEPMGGWDKVVRREKISLLAGIVNPDALSFEQLADLLTFPSDRVRGLARRDLNARFFQDKMVPLMKFLGSSDNKLSRSQTISILAAFMLKGAQADTFYRNWFEAKPDPLTVLSMLIARSDAGPNDLFNYKAAEYLTSASWAAPLETLRRLVLHPEPLARALVYARLNKAKPEERKLLQLMAVNDGNEKLRSFIEQRLGNSPAK